MCGILAVRNFDGAPVDESLLHEMRDTMHHRGPDGCGSLVEGSVGLAHRRLAILDLSSTGHQPMCNEHGSIWLVFNGEIYNYLELRRRLRRKGHSFRSTSDSEVIIHLYEEIGERCVQELDGMFAFVLWDNRGEGPGKLLGARDRLGIKPFYYLNNDDKFVCASEIKAIIADRSIPRRPDLLGIADYLFAGAPLAGRTFFEGISELPPGNAIRVGRDDVVTWPYWDLEYQYDNHRSDRTVKNELESLIDDAVRLHCRSDAPIGSHLSGGLDSSAVSAFAAGHVRPLKAFSIQFPEGGEAYDETRYARSVADFIGAEHLRADGRSDRLAELYPALLWHMDQPPAGGRDAGFSYFAAAELASRHVKVALTGHGGDEVFAGYPAQFETAYGTRKMFGAGSGSSAAAFQAGTLGRLGKALSREGIRGVAARVAARFRSVEQSGPEQKWVSLHCGPALTRNSLIGRQFISALNGYSPADAYLRPFLEAPTNRLLDRCLYHDLRVYLPQLLHKEDRASMAVSVESRVPLLDTQVVEYAASVPPEQKVPQLRPKALLRQAAETRLPAMVARRKDKMGFRLPLRDWATGRLKPLIDELAYGETAAERGVFNGKALRSRRLSPKEALTVLNVELWWKLFIDEDREWLRQARKLNG